MIHIFRNALHIGFGKIVVIMLLALVFLAPTLFVSSLALADEGEEYTELQEAGLGFASGVSTLVYLPLKVAYAVVGGTVGGLGWALTGGNTEVANSVWEPSVQGTYVITPDHFKGNEPVRFIGTSTYEETYSE